VLTAAAGRSRFVVIGEPVVAVDLINTVAAPGSPEHDDLLSTDLGAQAWWRVERARVPGGDLPDIEGLRRLRVALRDTIEALMGGRPVPTTAVSDLNFFMRPAPACRRLEPTATGLRGRQSTCPTRHR
jgi:hypothetical protein